MNHVTWAQHIKRAEVKGKFTKRAKDKSDAWPQCAVGEKFSNSGYEGESVSDTIWSGNHVELRELGLEFTRAVKADNVKSAKRIYKAIQKVEL